jgi:hypothetical protein
MRYFFVAALAGACSAIAAPDVRAQACEPGSLPALPAEALQSSRDAQTHAYQPALRGLWDLRGGGYVADIGAQAAHIYSQAGGLCWEDPLLTQIAPDESPFALYATSEDPADTVLAGSAEDTQFHLAPLAALPAACATVIDRGTPLYVFDAAVASLADFYTYSAERKVDWTQRATALRPRAAAATDEAALKPLLEELLDGVRDPHVSFAGSLHGEDFVIGTDPFSASPQTFPRLYAEYEQHAGGASFSDWIGQWLVDQNDRIGALLDPDPTGERTIMDASGLVAIRWGVLEGNVGYLLVNRVDALATQASFDAVLDRALGELQSTRALVLDIATNTGGPTDEHKRIAARFADRRHLAYTRQTPHDTCAAPQPFFIEPGGSVRYAKPVYVLTSDITASAGEYLTLYLRTLPQVRHIGQTTQGALAGSFGRSLPNGWWMGISNHVTLDAAGESHEVVGIRPDVAFDVFPQSGLDEGRARAIVQAAHLAADTVLRDSFDRVY